jgi:hypothetical protein
MKALALVLMLASGTAGQSVAPSVGSWTGQFEGRTFLRLELKSVNGSITGGMSIGNIEVDKQGALRSAKEAPRDLTPIVDFVDHGSSVAFARKDGDDTDHFELRLIDASHAELRFLLSDEDRQALAADGVPAPKPIALTKQSPAGIPR